MPDDAAVPLGPNEMPLPTGVQAETGALLSGLTAADLANIGTSPGAVQARGAGDNTEFRAIADVDPGKLDEAGWAILFPATVDPSVRAALDPLIARCSDSRPRSIGGIGCRSMPPSRDRPSCSRRTAPR